jgi:signal transduction histidine kinase
MRIRTDESNERAPEDIAESGRPTEEAEGDPPVPAVVLELRSALTSILACSEILRDYPDMPLEERERFLEAVIAEGKRLDRMVSRMLERSEFSRAAETESV